MIMDYLPLIEKKIAHTAQEAENILSLWRFKDDKFSQTVVLIFSIKDI